MATPAIKPIRAPEQAPPIDILPTLFGQGYGNYPVHTSTFVLSFALHTVGLVLVVVSGMFLVQNRKEIREQVTNLVTEISPYILPPAPREAGGGGGGGDADKLQASEGVLPPKAMEQLTPPVVVLRNEEPKLIATPTVVVPPEIRVTIGNKLGDPLEGVLASPSSGTGIGGGIGSGSGGGVGSGRGPGVGPGWGGGIGGGPFRVGGGVSAPVAIYSPEPEYSEEARKAKYQGTVVLWVVVGPDGRAHDIRVQRQLGMGLDEKAVEAIRQWRFEPARKDGTPVAVQINVEVNFRLY
jgi:protein TonB